MKSQKINLFLDGGLKWFMSGIEEKEIWGCRRLRELFTHYTDGKIILEIVGLAEKLYKGIRCNKEYRSQIAGFWRTEWRQHGRSTAIMVYFTSDLHLGHRAIITMQNRPFDSLEEMERTILRNFNAVVHRSDTVYILGDICHHMKVDAANEIISGMNGKKYLLIGNHDKKYDPVLFCEMRDFMTISVNGQRFALMHYPMLSWPHKSSGAIHLHGHIHAREDYNLKNREEGIFRYDVGVDANGFLPVSVQQISSFFNCTGADCRTGMTLREYKEKKLQDPEYAKAYAEIQPEIDEIRHSIDGAKSEK